MKRADPKKLAGVFSHYEQWLGAPDGFLVAIAVKENSYNPETGQYTGKTSPAGARGLMQLMPISLVEIRKSAGLRVNPDDPVQAICGAAVMLAVRQRQLRAIVGRQPTWAELIAGYNGGNRGGRIFMSTGRPASRETAGYLSHMRAAIGQSLDHTAAIKV
ncbi:transglycosylase SLT domain-containing protein [Leeia sp.]|uniref:transglycosylase SLT domain-containing protein n=1 Tax=Leeia sp. TaxID=2884678 RepID=UPI0035B1AE4A